MAEWRRRAYRHGLTAGAILFFGGLLLSGLRPEALLLSGLGALVGAGAVAVGVRRAVCPSCQRVAVLLGASLAHCSFCGTRFPDTPGADPGATRGPDG